MSGSGGAAGGGASAGAAAGAARGWLRNRPRATVVVPVLQRQRAARAQAAACLFFPLPRSADQSTRPSDRWRKRQTKTATAPKLCVDERRAACRCLKTRRSAARTWTRQSRHCCQRPASRFGIFRAASTRFSSKRRSTKNGGHFVVCAAARSASAAEAYRTSSFTSTTSPMQR